MFPATSRYHGIEKKTLVMPDGREIVYLKRRFLPDFSGIIVMAEHIVAQGDRLDNITAQYLGDPEQFWRICDANTEMNPDDLTAIVLKKT